MTFDVINTQTDMINYRILQEEYFLYSAYKYSWLKDESSVRLDTAISRKDCAMPCIMIWTSKFICMSNLELFLH